MAFAHGLLGGKNERSMNALMKRRINLRMFDEGTAGTAPGAAAAAATAAQPAAQPAAQAARPGYTLEQVDEIVETRSRAAVAGFFRKQGMSEDEITEAIKDYQAKKAAQTPNVDAITRERDAALAELNRIKENAALAKKGVPEENIEFVGFKVRQAMAADKKLTFEKAAEKFLADNPRYASAQGAYRVQTAPGAPAAAAGQYKSEEEKYKALDEQVAAMFR